MTYVVDCIISLKVNVFEMPIICICDLIFSLQTAIFCNMDHECVFKKVVYLILVSQNVYVLFNDLDFQVLIVIGVPLVSGIGFSYVYDLARDEGCDHFP